MCSELTGPLYAAASEEQFPLSKEHEELIRKLKEAILTKPLLAHPDLNKPFIYTSDASNNACGGVLSQIQPDGRKRPIAFFSHKFSPAEQKYSTFEQEGLGLVLGVKKFRTYLLARLFTLRTDSKAWKYLHIFEPRNSRVDRWLATLSEYKFDVQYIKGKDNIVADAMSRLPDEIPQFPASMPQLPASMPQLPASMPQLPASPIPQPPIPPSSEEHTSELQSH